STVPNFDIYIASQQKMAKAAAGAHATVLMSNHTEFDSAVPKIKAIAARRRNKPHPFEVGEDTVQRYFKVTEECSQAQRMQRNLRHVGLGERDFRAGNVRRVELSALACSRTEVFDIPLLSCRRIRYEQMDVMHRHRRRDRLVLVDLNADTVGSG